MLDNTVEDLVQQIRDVTDEDNTSDVTDAFIIRNLNRAQQDLIRIIGKRFNPHFMKEVQYTAADLVSDSDGVLRVLNLQGNAFAFKINQVDVRLGQAWLRVHQVPFSETLGLDNQTSSSVPLVYAIRGNQVYLYPKISSGAVIRIRYQFRAPKLVKTQGRITSFDSDAGTFILDSIGSGITTSVDSLGAFVNIIDPFSGLSKGTLQVSGINTSTKQITIKSASLDRSTVFGNTVSTSLPTDLALDDLVCLADGTCVPYLSMDLSNYLVELAAFNVKRSIGQIENADFSERDRIEEAISTIWSGRDYTLRRSKGRGYSAYSWQWFFRGSP